MIGKPLDDIRLKSLQLFQNPSDILLTKAALTCGFSSKNIEREVIDMFGFEGNEQEKRKALLETGEELGEARGEARGKIKTLCDLIVHGLVISLSWG